MTEAPPLCRLCPCGIAPGMLCGALLSGRRETCSPQPPCAALHHRGTPPDASAVPGLPFLRIRLFKAPPYPAVPPASPPFYRRPHGQGRPVGAPPLPSFRAKRPGGRCGFGEKKFLQMPAKEDYLPQYPVLAARYGRRSAVGCASPRPAAGPASGTAGYATRPRG